jgi:hypothetical protein
MVLFGSIVLGWISVAVWLWFVRSVAFRLAGAGGGIGAELGVTEAFGCVRRTRRRLCWFRLPKQAALHGEFRLGISGFRHGPNSGALIVRVISGCSRRRGCSTQPFSV